MWPVSEDFKRAIREGAHWVIQADVKERGVAVAGGENVPIVGGEIIIDAAAAIRRTATIRILAEDDAWIPENASDLLFPVGRELHIQAGFRFPWNGVTELVPIGVFRVSRPKVRVTQGNRTLEVVAYDRSRSVDRHRFFGPYSIPGGTPYNEAIQDLILRTYPWFTQDDFLFMESEFSTITIVHDRTESPWERATAMATSMGAELFFDQLGRCVLQPEPDLSHAEPEWKYGENGGELTITEVGTDLDDERGYNGVVVTGQNASTNTPPVHAEAWDTDPASPTYYNPANPSDSLYGAVPFFITSEFVYTEAQAQAAANANLRRVIGMIKSCDFSGVPNFAHDVNDVIHVVNAASKLDEINILDSYKFQLELGSTGVGSLRQRRVLS